MENNSYDHYYGPFYVNRNDSRIFVPKRFKYFGWTLNFGNIYTYILIAVIVGLIIASNYIK